MKEGKELRAREPKDRAGGRVGWYRYEIPEAPGKRKWEFSLRIYPQYTLDIAVSTSDLNPETRAYIKTNDRQLRTTTTPPFTAAAGPRRFTTLIRGPPGRREEWRTEET